MVVQLSFDFTEPTPDPACTELDQETLNTLIELMANLIVSAHQLKEKRDHE